jgi:hypothetical protein
MDIYLLSWEYNQLSVTDLVLPTIELDELAYSVLLVQPALAISLGIKGPERVAICSNDTILTAGY